jgi:molybdopterin-guanine dinucleotide biosynthesis protein B
MNVIGFSGYSGSGKTTLIEQLIVRFRQAGLRVSVLKHAHHAFDIDHEGKDSWRHRKAGAFEVIVASDQRFAKMRDYELPRQHSVHELLAELSDCDWVFVEGFKHADIPKIAVWHAESEQPPTHADDPHVIALATNAPERLPAPPQVPVLNLNQVDAIGGFLLANATRCHYTAPSC